MNKKSVFIIILATILALIISLLMSNKKADLTTQEEETIQEVVQEVTTVDEKMDAVEEDKAVVVEPAKNAEIIKTAEDKVVDSATNTFSDEVKLQEATIVQESEYDYGVRKVDGTDIIEVTREFKLKTPTTYSFKDFGFLYKIK